MSVTVENVMSLSLSICQAAVPSATLPLSPSHSLTLNLTFSEMFTEGRTEDNTAFQINPMRLVRLPPAGSHFCFPSTVSKMLSYSETAIFISEHLKELFLSVSIFCTDRSDISFFF